MGERTSYPPGTFSWADLATSDPDDAKRFYTGLFGWDFEGMPTFWGSYVTVESADSMAARANELGGTLVVEPFDVMDVGRMAVVQDPTGAMLSVWEPHGSIGANLVNVPGAITLNQLSTPDTEKAEAFYGALFGWRAEQVAEGDNPYWGIYLGDRLNGGMMRIDPDGGVPPHWLTYFGSAEVDADAGRIGELGGQVMLPPMDVPGGRITVIRDPQGAMFGLFAGRFDD